MSEALAAFLEASVRTATPLAFAALGETIAERAGVINIGLEGCVIAGAFAATVAGIAGGAGAGFAAGAAAGAVVALLLAAMVVGLRADQIITGTAVTLLALGLTGTLYRFAFGESGVALAVPTMAPLAVPGLSRLPFVGRALFAQPAPTYALYALVPLAWWWLYRTHDGLALRAVGENPAAAVTAGVSPGRVRLRALLVNGALGGACGATLVLAQVGTFAEGMSAGRGFIAIAIVALGRWRPVRVALASLLFGAASALQYLFQAMGWNVPYQLFLALPYVLTLAALAGGGARGAAPAALGARDLVHAWRMKSLPLRHEPTVREAYAILASLESLLARGGVAPRRRGLELRFRVPAPWRALHLGLLAAATAGKVKVSAGAGEPWKVRYSLDFTLLRGIAVVASVAAVVAGFGLPRLTLVNLLVAVWLLLFFAPRWLAMRRFDAMLRESASAVLERRRTPRDVAAT